jgi:hypothetical protein
VCASDLLFRLTLTEPCVSAVVHAVQSLTSSPNVAYDSSLSVPLIGPPLKRARQDFDSDGGQPSDSVVEVYGSRMSILYHLYSSLYLLTGFKKLVLNGTLTDPFLSFHENFWGKPLPEEHKTPNKEQVNTAESEKSNSGDMDEEYDKNDDPSLIQTTPILKSGLKDILIRAEYMRMYAYVESVYQNLNLNQDPTPKPPLVVVTGQPGIGGCDSNYMMHLFLI